MPGTPFRLISEAFGESEIIPRAYSREGGDRSPPLAWTRPAGDVRSYVLRVVDPDAPAGTFTHWVLYDIPADCEGLPEGASHIGVSGRNDFEYVGWGGPHPPPKHGDHHYVFELAALDVTSLGLPEGARRDEVERGMRGHVVDEAKLVGRYRRH